MVEVQKTEGAVFCVHGEHRENRLRESAAVVIAAGRVSLRVEFKSILIGDGDAGRGVIAKWHLLECFANLLFSASLAVPAVL